MRVVTRKTIPILMLFLTACSSIKFFPDELGIYGTGEEENLSQIINLLKKSKEPNAAAAVLFWKNATLYNDTSVRKFSWSHGISTEGKTCKQAVKSSLENCAKHMDDYHVGEIHNKEEPYYGCHILAIKCKNIKNELNHYNILEYE